VLAVGTELAETDSWGWIARDQWQAHPHRYRSAHDRTDYPATVAILADAGRSMDAIAAELGGKGSAGRIPAESWRACAGEPAGWAALQTKHRKVLDVVRAVLPEDGHDRVRHDSDRPIPRTIIFR